MRFLTTSGGLTTSFAQQLTYNYRLLDEKCDLEQCLFIGQAAEEAGYLDYMVGTVLITGYYRSIFQETMTGERLTCPALTVTNAPQAFQQAFAKLIGDGNFVNRIDDEGQLVLAISLENLQAAEIKHIKRATRQRPINLTLFKPPPTESELPDCGSLFEILRVQQDKK